MFKGSDPEPVKLSSFLSGRPDVFSAFRVVRRSGPVVGEFLLVMFPCTSPLSQSPFLKFGRFLLPASLVNCYKKLKLEYELTNIY